MDIDVEIYKFIDKVEQYHNTDERPFRKAALFGDGETPMVDLGEVSNFSMTEFDEYDLSIKAKFKDIDGKLLGLNKESYSQLYTMLSPLTDDIFKSKCDLNFLVENSFDWIMDTFIKKKADFNITSYLSNRIEEETSEYHFYYRISSISIEHSISIGNVIITHFTKENVRDYYNAFNEKNPGKSFKDFKKLHAHIFNSVVAFTKIEGGYSMAESLSLKEVELAINVMKCFCFRYSFIQLNSLPDLDYKKNKNNLASYWSLAKGDINASNLRVKRFGGVAPVRLTKEFIEWMEKRGLNTFSNFIKTKKNDEMYQIIIELINQFAALVATNDNHEKAVQAISILESIVISKDTRGKGKGQGKIKKVISKLVKDETQKNNVNRCCTDFYNVRNRYVHNSIRVPFVKNDLELLLLFELEIIRILINLNARMKTMDEVLAYFEITD